jgi:hypothetical protein
MPFRQFPNDPQGDVRLGENHRRGNGTVPTCAQSIVIRKVGTLPSLAVLRNDLIVDYTNVWRFFRRRFARRRRHELAVVTLRKLASRRR